MALSVSQQEVLTSPKKLIDLGIGLRLESFILEPFDLRCSIGVQTAWHLLLTRKAKACCQEQKNLRTRSFVTPDYLYY